MDVAGVDGCEGGWLVARADWSTQRLHLIGLSFYPTFRDVLTNTESCGAVAVDMPIGLSEHGRRQADILAHRTIGPRRSSVFPSPVRAVLLASSYAEACFISLNTHRDGKKISKQTYALLPKIREVDAAMTPQLQVRVVESHPEVGFWALNKEHHLLNSKHNTEGLDERRRLLATIYGERVNAVSPVARSTQDDVFDACVLAWTASHIATGSEKRLPPEPQRDARGLRMEIVY